MCSGGTVQRERNAPRRRAPADAGEGDGAGVGRTELSDAFDAFDAAAAAGGAAGEHAPVRVMPANPTAPAPTEADPREKESRP